MYDLFSDMDQFPENLVPMLDEQETFHQDITEMENKMFNLHVLTLLSVS